MNDVAAGRGTTAKPFGKRLVATCAAAVVIALVIAAFSLVGCPGGRAGAGSKSVDVSTGDGTTVCVTVDGLRGYDVSAGEGGVFVVRDRDGSDVVTGVVTSIGDFDAYKRRADDGTLGDEVTENSDAVVAWTYLGGSDGAERGRIVRVDDGHAVLMGTSAGEDKAKSAFDTISVSAR